MKQQSQKLFSFILKKRGFFFFVPLFAFLFLFFPTSQAHAGWVWNLIIGIASIPFAVAFLLAAFLSSLAVSFCGWIMGWIIGPNFMTLSYTNPAGNPIIAAGLSITQGFVNMVLVLVLVYIALATILRLSGYETKKLLVTFVIVALLVNFSPVICGLIVDAANIVMNFFLSNITQLTSFASNMSALGKNITSLFDWENFKVSGMQGFLFSLLALTVVNILTCVMFLLFSILFLARHLVIWVLVILSPLAFAFYILPSTKKYWERWWNYFLQWNIMGITASFFLYLAIVLAHEMPNVIDTSNMGTTGGGAAGFNINSIIVNVIPVFFLFIGLMAAMESGMIGASAAMSLTKKAGKAGGMAGLRRAGNLARGAAERIPGLSAAQKFAQRQAVAGDIGTGIKGAKGTLIRGMAGATGINYMRRGLGKIAGTGVTEVQKKKVNDMETKLKGKTADAQLSGFNGALSDTERIGALQAAIEDGNLGDLMDEKKYGKSAVKSSEIQRLTKQGARWDSDKKLKRAVPHLAETTVSDEEFNEARNKDSSIKNKHDFIVKKMKPSDYEKVAEQAIDITPKDNTPEEQARAANAMNVVDAMLAKATGGHISQLIQKHGQVAISALQGRIDKGVEVNPALKKYFTSSAGQAMVGLDVAKIKETPKIITNPTETEFKAAVQESKREKPKTIFETPGGSGREKPKTIIQEAFRKKKEK